MDYIRSNLLVLKPQLAPNYISSAPIPRTDMTRRRSLLKRETHCFWMLVTNLSTHRPFTRVRPAKRASEGAKLKGIDGGWWRSMTDEDLLCSNATQRNATDQDGHGWWQARQGLELECSEKERHGLRRHGPALCPMPYALCPSHASLPLLAARIGGRISFTTASLPLRPSAPT
jgi:hypothetical protein